MIIVSIPFCKLRRKKIPRLQEGQEKKDTFFFLDQRVLDTVIRSGSLDTDESGGKFFHLLLEVVCTVQKQKFSTDTQMMQLIFHYPLLLARRVVWD